MNESLQFLILSSHSNRITFHCCFTQHVIQIDTKKNSCLMLNIPSMYRKININFNIIRLGYKIIRLKITKICLPYSVVLNIHTHAFIHNILIMASPFSILWNKNEEFQILCLVDEFFLSFVLPLVDIIQPKVPCYIIKITCWMDEKRKLTKIFLLLLFFRLEFLMQTIYFLIH